MWLFSISFRWRLIVDGVPPRAIWWNSFARLDPLAYGVLLSVLLDGSKLHRFRNARRTIAISAVSLIVTAGYCSPREIVLQLFGKCSRPAGCTRMLRRHPYGARNGRSAGLMEINPVLKYWVEFLWTISFPRGKDSTDSKTIARTRAASGSIPGDGCRPSLTLTIGVAARTTDGSRNPCSG